VTLSKSKEKKRERGNVKFKIGKERGKKLPHGEK
jgi:hypothetical protein